MNYWASCSGAFTCGAPLRFGKRTRSQVFVKVFCLCGALNGLELSNFGGVLCPVCRGFGVGLLRTGQNRERRDSDSRPESVSCHWEAGAKKQNLKKQRWMDKLQIKFSKTNLQCYTCLSVDVDILYYCVQLWWLFSSNLNVLWINQIYSWGDLSDNKIQVKLKVVFVIFEFQKRGFLQEHFSSKKKKINKIVQFWVA